MHVVLVLDEMNWNAKLHRRRMKGKEAVFVARHIMSQRYGGSHQFFQGKEV
jgi:hypothetical protein